jgi:hypothetical protein
MVIVEKAPLNNRSTTKLARDIHRTDARDGFVSSAVPNELAIRESDIAGQYANGTRIIEDMVRQVVLKAATSEVGLRRSGNVNGPSDSMVLDE